MSKAKPRGSDVKYVRNVESSKHYIKMVVPRIKAFQNMPILSGLILPKHYLKEIKVEFN